MEAIRAAGGHGKAKLKSAKERKLAEKKKKHEEKERGVDVVATGGDLMSDLAAKLQMRRKGISGTKVSVTSQGEQESGGAMDRISSMIPPPPAPSVSHEEEGWE